MENKVIKISFNKKVGGFFKIIDNIQPRSVNISNTLNFCLNFFNSSFFICYHFWPTLVIIVSDYERLLTPDSLTLFELPELSFTLLSNIPHQLVSILMCIMSLQASTHSHHISIAFLAELYNHNYDQVLTPLKSKKRGRLLMLVKHVRVLRKRH